MSKQTQLLHKLKHVYSHNTKLVLDVENKDIELIIEGLEKQVAKLADLGYYYYMNVDKNPVVCEDSVWIPSAAELGGDSLSYVIKGQGSPYPLFTTDESRKKSANGSSTYITRSSDISYYHQYAAVDSMGNWTRLSPGTYNGLIFGFCL